MSNEPHVVLIGDSIFDNARYVASNQAVVDHLQKAMGSTGTCTLVAVDGDTSRDVHTQLARVPASATHLVLSAGGNDALGWLPTLSSPVGSVIEALDPLHNIQSDFRNQYEGLLGQIGHLQKPTLVCTIYDAVPGLSPALKTALSLFNDVVLRVALRHSFKVLELRDLLSESDDFSSVSPIEPSETAGLKLAKAISDWVSVPSRLP